MVVQEEVFEVPFLKEKAVRKVYENGYQFVYVPKRGDVFNINTWVRTGSIHENDVNNGVSHFLEHLMFKGTQRFKPGEFDRAMESMGAVINAATWKDFTFYYVTGPKGAQNKNFEKVVDMHADMLLFSTLPDEEIGETYDPSVVDETVSKRERGVVIEEIAMRKDMPGTKAFNVLNDLMYPESHPYRRDVIGTPEIIANIPRSSIQKYYREWYSPKNMSTVVVGDFDLAWLEAKLLESFDFMRQEDHEPISFDYTPYFLDKYPDGKKEYIQEGDYQTTFFIMGFPGPRPSQLKECIALDVVSKILGDGRSSRFYQALIEKPEEPLFNAISCGQSTYKLGNLLYIHGNFNGSDIEGCKQAVYNEIKALGSDSPISEEEFHRAVKKLKVEFAETSETASGIAETIGESLTITGTLDGYVQYWDVLQQLQYQDAVDAVHQWLKMDQCYTSLLVPKEFV